MGDDVVYFGKCLAVGPTEEHPRGKFREAIGRMKKRDGLYVKAMYYNWDGSVQMDRLRIYESTTGSADDWHFIYAEWISTPN